MNLRLFAASQPKSATAPLSHACATVESTANKPKHPQRVKDAIIRVSSSTRYGQRRCRKNQGRKSMTGFTKRASFFAYFLLLACYTGAASAAEASTDEAAIHAITQA